MRRVLLDFDGVIVDMLGSLQRTLSAEGISFNPEGVETYDFHGSIGCDRQKVNAIACLYIFIICMVN